MSFYSQVCGIDVSKDTLDYCILPQEIHTSDIPTVHQISNESENIMMDFGRSMFDQTLFVVESTGTYSSKVVHALSKMSRPIFLVNPYKSKSYMAAMGVTNKNDAQAAYSLAHMGRSLDVRLYKPPTMQMQRRKQLLSSLNALEKQKRSLNNQIHALDQCAVKEENAKAALLNVLKSVEEQIAILKKQLSTRRLESDFKKKIKLGASVIGIGNKTAETLLLLTNNLETFEHPGQVAKFLGIVSWSHDSGTSIRKRGGITKFGNSYARGLLYMCTRSAIRHNKACKELYQRLRANNKPHKVAAVAVMNKLVKQFFFCVKRESMFDNDHYLKNKKN